MRCWLVLALAVPFAGLPARAADDPAAALFKTITDKIGAGKPFSLVVTLTVKDEAAGKKLEAAAAKVSAATLKEKGCLMYEFHHAADDPNTYFLLEKWADLAALQAHFQADHTKEILALLGEVSAAPPKIVVAKPLSPAK